VFTSFVAAGSFDRLVLYVAPLLLGDRGLALLAGGPPTLDDAERLVLHRVEHVGDDAVLHLGRREG